MKNIIKFAAAIIICFAPGVIGSYFTAATVDTWYLTLAKPALNPPGWAFGVVWPILYLLMAIALYLIWNARTTQKRLPLNLFYAQLILNGLWSIFFFGLKSPFYALIELLILWILIVLVMAEFYSINKWSVYLLAPYIAWVSFAAYLNYSIWVLN